MTAEPKPHPENSTGTPSIQSLLCVDLRNPRTKCCAPSNPTADSRFMQCVAMWPGTSHNLALFGWYRIGVGAVVAVLAQVVDVVA